MSLPIITAIRQRRDLKESVLHTAQEIAHKASIYGVAPVSLRYLAQKCHCCKQTIINHIEKLIALKILRKRVVWIKGNLCETNRYTFCIAWDKRPAHMCHSQISRPNLPHTEREKNTSLTEELENQRKAIRLGFITPGSKAWEATQETIVRLERLLARE